MGEPWEELMKPVKKHDKEEVEGWREDIDTLLVFVSAIFFNSFVYSMYAGLFSAAVTAYTVESYKWLQPDPTDTTTQLLYQISLQLANSTVPAFPNPSQQEFTPEFSSIRINILWFLSLILALSSALLSILCKQWLREYCRDTHTKTQMQALVLRQLRYASFQKWHVRTFITCLPLLLELALLLFFAGVLELLWSLHQTVAALASGVVGCTVVFFFVTAMLPTYSFMKTLNDTSGDYDVPTFCPYKSPLAWLFFRLFQIIHSYLKLTSGFPKITNWSRGDLEIIKDSSYRERYYLGDHRHTRLLEMGLRWTLDAFGDSARMAGHIFHCLSNLEMTLPSYMYIQLLRSILKLPKTVVYTASGGMVALEVPSQTLFKFLDQYGEVNNVFLGELTLRALNEASEHTPEYVYQYLQTGSSYILVLIEHAILEASDSPEVLHEVIYQTQVCISNCISSHIKFKSSNNTHSLVLMLCEEMVRRYKNPCVNEGILAILDFMLEKMEEDIKVRPLLWIRPELLDFIGNFIFRPGGLDRTSRNLLVNDSVQWETVAVQVSPSPSGVDDNSRDRLEWEEFWEEYLRSAYLLPSSDDGQKSIDHPSIKN
ncbi:hypothetical protein K435DRAFT_910771 [Dendrothele bispora CBS 962.96]|uniref:DUF6535 domain-containing protein n=1 Tax=Dendrothele bispora (strain CBS 962.96) TaxID=1314807 RepID=A0A4S8LMY6_DENBC|nr:hypothetical protein K435DRAFT_910771 [Dendrothele bispora CBS 962.96]